MPPSLDVYALTANRDRSTIERFLSAYVDVARSVDRRGEELMVLPLGQQDPAGPADFTRWDWIPVSTLGEILELGLSEPSRAFSVYLTPREPWCGAMLTFTVDGQLVVGVSLDDPLELPEVRAEASHLMRELIHLVDGDRAWVVLERPPPLDPIRDRPWDQPWALDHAAAS